MLLIMVLSANGIKFDKEHVYERGTPVINVLF